MRRKAAPMSDAKTFRVVVAQRPQVTSIEPTANGYAITFVTIPGRTYRVEYKDSLDDPSWLPLDADVVATADSLVVNDDLGTSPQRFYRILVVN